VKAVILGGTISIMGVELIPSSTAHTVFAPRSHPVPSFMCIASAESNHSLRPRLMASMRGRGALALFPSCSGVESLERISPRYRGLFGDQERCSLGIPGLQVSMMLSNVNCFIDLSPDRGKVSPKPNVTPAELEKGLGAFYSSGSVWRALYWFVTWSERIRKEYVFSHADEHPCFTVRDFLCLLLLELTFSKVDRCCISRL